MSRPSPLEILVELERRLVDFGYVAPRHAVDAHDGLPRAWHTPATYEHLFTGACAVLRPGPAALSIGLIGTAARAIRGAPLRWPRAVQLYAKFHLTPEEMRRLGDTRPLGLVPLLPLLRTYELRPWLTTVYAVAPAEAAALSVRAGCHSAIARASARPRRRAMILV